MVITTSQHQQKTRVMQFSGPKSVKPICSLLLVSCSFTFPLMFFVFFLPPPPLSFHLSIPVHRLDLVSRSFIAGSTRSKFSLKQDRFCLLTFFFSLESCKTCYLKSFCTFHPTSIWMNTIKGLWFRYPDLQSVWARPHEINVGSHPIFSPIPKYTDIPTRKSQRFVSRHLHFKGLARKASIAHGETKPCLSHNASWPFTISERLEVSHGQRDGLL